MDSGCVLVAYASAHHSTEEIATTIADTLRGVGLEVDLRPADEVRDVKPYRAVVLGSAVYMLRWLKPALDVLRRRQADLAARPTWLFGSGPLGETPETADPSIVPPPRDVAELARRIGARAYTNFGGRLTADTPGAIEALMIRAGLVGDWRDLERVRAYAAGIAADLADTAADLAATPAAAG